MAIDLSWFNDHKQALLDFTDEDTCHIVIYSTPALFAGWDLSRERAKYLIIPAAPGAKKAKAILIHQVPDNFVDWDSGKYEVLATPDGQTIVEGVFEGGTLALTWNGLKGVDPNIGDCWVPIEIERGVGIAVTLPAWLFAKKRKTKTVSA